MTNDHRGVPWILEADVERLLQMKPLVEAVREAFVHLAEGTAEIQPRRRVRAPGMILHAMSAADSVWNLIAWKNYVTGKPLVPGDPSAKFVVALYTTDSLLPLAFIEADKLGQMRTGAATAVAIDRLTPPDLDAMALFGTGWQAEGQLAAALAVRPITTVRVAGRVPERRQSFCERMTARYGVDVQPANSPEAAAREMRLVISATSSSTPVVDSDQLPREGLFVAMGSNWPNKQEFDPAFVWSCSHVVVDHRQSCRNEAGELIAAARNASFEWSQTVELGDLLLPPDPSREMPPAATLPAVPSGRVLFKSVGLAIEDLAAAKLVVEAFRRSGIA
ncbi:MAG TPA: ornithine cyclodeaminase family protein [Pirellulaceae bacterium]|jgi:ornithine cyclodeaminase/alanine dehydrogenase-like protein (mu-crystallin family)|nr:ornithine cyclodeaminase family protein [Pirellulaceae bacterium]